MQFVIIARDAADQEALQRRMSARAEHIRHVDESMKNMILGAATFDDQENMNGSVMIVDFQTRKDLDAWLESEPYVVQGVWGEVTILQCKIGPSFCK